MGSVKVTDAMGAVALEEVDVVEEDAMEIRIAPYNNCNSVDIKDIYQDFRSADWDALQGDG